MTTPPFSVRCAGQNPGDGSTFDVTCPGFAGDSTVTVAAGDRVALIEPIPNSVAVTLLGVVVVTESGAWNPLDGQPEPGDLIVVVGPDEPLQQTGMIGVVRADGTVAGAGIGALIAWDLAHQPPAE